jgi:acid phosphatase
VRFLPRLAAALAVLAPLLPASAPPAAAATRPTKVLVIVEENHSAAQAIDGMPYLRSLGRTYGYTSGYHAVAHPSLPNYLALAGGSTFGVRDDKSPAYHHLTGRTVFDQAILRGKTAKTYAESMPANCYLSTYGRYAVRHNPWTYFSDSGPRANCKKLDVPAGSRFGGALRTDVLNGTLPTVGMLIPNTCNDGHDCPLSTADDWLSRWIPFIMAGPDYKAGRLAIVVTFDEDDYSAANQVLTTVVSPYTSHVVSGAAYTHYSWTRYADQLAGAVPLRNAANAVSLRDAFHI